MEKAISSMTQRKRNQFKQQLSHWVGRTICMGMGLVICTMTVPVVGQSLVSDAVAHRAGLTVDWQSQINVGPDGRVVDYDLVVDENDATTFYALEYMGNREIYTSKTINRFGKALGEGVEEFVELRKEIIAAELAGINKADEKISFSTYTLPRAIVYAAVSDGSIYAINADTGKTLWQRVVGSSSLPTSGLGADANHVAISNGSTVYCLDAVTGKSLWSQSAQGAIAASPAVNDQYVFLPLMNGHIEVFELKAKGVGSRELVGYSRPMNRPTVTESTVSWPTKTGDYNVAQHKTIRGVKYRLRSDGTIKAPGAAKNGMLFVASTDGFVYALNEISGALAWQYSTGVRIIQAPVAVGNSVYVITTDNKMYKLNARTGDEVSGWERPLTGIQNYVGASEKNLYVTNTLGQLAVYDQASKTNLGTIPTSGIDRFVTNNASDRLYVGNRYGLLQSIREKSSPIPFFHDNATEEAPQPEAVANQQGVPGLNTEDPFGDGGTDDPFGDAGSDDPFGAASDDPFARAANDDPFAGGGGDDPFAGGGGDDPFAGATSPATPATPAGGGVNENDPFGGAENSEPEPPAPPTQTGGGENAGGENAGGENAGGESAGGGDENANDPFGGG